MSTYASVVDFTVWGSRAQNFKCSNSTAVRVVRQATRLRYIIEFSIVKLLVDGASLWCATVKALA